MKSGQKIETKKGDNEKMDLHLKESCECKYDAVSLGEVMLRLDPGEGRIRTRVHFEFGKAAENIM